MICDALVFRQGREQHVSVFAVYDRPGMLGIRAEKNPSAIYLKLSDLEYLIDEARRAQPTPKGTDS